MSLGEKLLDLRKKAGLSQEEVASKLDVSRQTISKWETDQTVPELIKTKMLSQLFNVSFAYLISENPLEGDLTSIEMIVDEIDWTSAWSKKYPILAAYQDLPGIEPYRKQISQMYDTFQKQFNFNHADTALILKDILYQKYRSAKNKSK